MSGRTYRLTLTEEHLHVLMSAAELAARLAIGQFREVVDAAGAKPNVSLRMRREAEAALALARRLLMPELKSEHAYWGISSDAVSDDARVAFDIVQVVRHRLAWDEHPEGEWTVNFDAPLRTSAGLPLVQIEAVEIEPTSVAKRRRKTKETDK